MYISRVRYRVRYTKYDMKHTVEAVYKYICKGDSLATKLQDEQLISRVSCFLTQEFFLFFFPKPMKLQTQ